MMHTSTPHLQRPSAQTLDYLRRFAREYQPTRPAGTCVILQYGDYRPLGNC